MLENIKKLAMEKAMKLMSNPKVGEFLSNPKVTQAMTRAFELKAKVEEHLRPLTDIIKGLRQKIFGSN